MPPAARQPFELPPGTALAAAVTRGRAAFEQADAARVDVEYRKAVRLAGPDDPGLWLALVTDHVAGLLALGATTRASQRCAEYFAQAGYPAQAEYPEQIDGSPFTLGHHLALLILRVEVRSALADHRGVEADVGAVRDALRSRPESLTLAEQARLSRVAGLAAAEGGDEDRARQDLTAARELFDQAGVPAGVQAVDRDLLLLAVRQGDQTAVADVLADEHVGEFAAGPPRTVADRLLLAAALRRQLRYEAALEVLPPSDSDIESALRFPVLHERVVLLRLIRDDEAAERLMPALRDAAAASSDPVAGTAVLARLSVGGEPGDAYSSAFDRRLQHARRLISDVHSGEAGLTRAGHLLEELRSRARTDREVATWYLAAGELGFTRDGRAGQRPHLQDAVHCLGEAVARAVTDTLSEVRVEALRLLGRACARLTDSDWAARHWAEAHRIEEHIAGRQRTDATRIRMLHAVPDEYDERVRAASEALGTHQAEGAAAIVVAMEAARGAAILGGILPEQGDPVRDLPQPGDLHAAWRWVADMGRRLPRSQVVWLMHATPDRVHHAVVGRGLLHHASVATARHNLTVAIDALMACWSDAGLVEQSIANGAFVTCLQQVAGELGLAAVFPDLPPRISRIAVVAGDALADIPFAALTIPGSVEPIGCRFALSDLPCLSAQRPLAHRAHQVRGDTMLLVGPPAEGITRAAPMRGRTVLDGPQATPVALRARLALHRDRLVRIDSHGQHDPSDPARLWWLQLAAHESESQSDGRLTPEQLQGMDLGGCGTLVLGACESGMAQRRGRDERVGFVRAAVCAGAAAVVAARWQAADAVAAVVLDRFDRYVRYLPRDVALQRAQLDACRGKPGTRAAVPAVDHPARWACWTLYGDSGQQTAAGPVRRVLRRAVTGRGWHAVRR